MVECYESVWLWQTNKFFSKKDISKIGPYCHLLSCILVIYWDVLTLTGPIKYVYVKCKAVIRLITSISLDKWLPLPICKESHLF